VTKEKLFGAKCDPKKIVECGDKGEDDEKFTMTVKGLAQRFILVPQNVKEAYLIQMLKEHKLKKNQQAIIFASTCRNCHFLALLLRELDFDVALIHSQLEQRVRTNNLLKFKSNFCKILIATDVASRGLDIPSVELVLNYDVPKNPKDYIHRVGRTARAGRGGTSMTIVSQYDVSLIKSIEEFTHNKLEKIKIDEDKALEDHTSLLKVMQVVRIKMSE
jgi:ATP-dependent RNA helicase DDX49/DBP8